MAHNTHQHQGTKMVSCQAGDARLLREGRNGLMRQAEQAPERVGSGLQCGRVARAEGAQRAAEALCCRRASQGCCPRAPLCSSSLSSARTNHSCQGGGLSHTKLLVREVVPKGQQTVQGHTVCQLSDKRVAVNVCFRQPISAFVSAMYRQRTLKSLRHRTSS